MRIISGKYKGRVLRTPDNFDLRPTTDLGKESLFNILNNVWDFEGLTVLDLFAGTGAISIEFASRGAEMVTAVELHPRHSAFIEQSAALLGAQNIKTLKTDAMEFLTRCAEPYNIIFADPPYKFEGVDKIPDLIFSRNLLTESGELILEHSEDFDFSYHPCYVQTRRYGAVHFSFFEKQAE